LQGVIRREADFAISRMSSDLKDQCWPLRNQSRFRC